VSDDINSLRKQVWKALGDKAYRDTFVDSHIGTNLAAQIYALREAQGWTQAQLAERVGMAQGRISVMENPSYEQFTLSTLKRLRAAFDVALVVKFIRFTEFAEGIINLTPEKLAPPNFEEEMKERSRGEERSQSAAFEASLSLFRSSQDGRVTGSALKEPPPAPERPRGRDEIDQSNVIPFLQRAA
jgi:transcriptional regulator with XRE-family HTH domain